MAPFHTTDEDPTLCIERDFELMEWLDKLNYDEAWIGEHHSGGFEIIGSPEVFIAAAAVRTHRIKLGTGVLSLPYQHPFMVADRMLQLDHQTRGRAMFGLGHGILLSDALAMGIPVEATRERMTVALEAILRLLAGERVTMETDGFTMRDAKLQLRPYTDPRPHLAVAGSKSPFSSELAGLHGLGLLSSGLDLLESNWQVANEVATAHGRTMDRQTWRISAPFHIAETREQARAEVARGFERWHEYRLAISPKGHVVVDAATVEEIISEKRGAIGTPEDAVAFLEMLWSKTGGFGCILLLDHNWADWDATRRSYDMFARYVLPKFQELNRERIESMQRLRSNRDQFSKISEASRKAVFERILGAGAVGKRDD